jgi:hypothetical protein
MMDPYIGSQLIIVEGLTGSGKSTMAHFITRQLQYRGIPASWVHEGAVPHPILTDLDSSLSQYMAEIRTNWIKFVNQVGPAPEVRVIEASFYNNLFETLMAHQVANPQIFQYADELEAIIAPLNPALVYLVQDDIEQALERNFLRRGSGFRNFVIRLATTNPLAKANLWEGYAGMLRYWQVFVALTDELYERFPGWKIKIDNTAGNWDVYNQQVLDFLSLPGIPEQAISPGEVQRLIGHYLDSQRGYDFTVRSESGELIIDFPLKVSARLVQRAHHVFEAEGWPFEIHFEVDDINDGTVMKICGNDVDYLPLLGIEAKRVSV